MPEPRVVIVGGGVIGLTAGWELARRGWRVTVLEAGEVGGGASFGNAGWVVPALSDPVPAPGVVGSSLRWMWRQDSPLRIAPRADLGFARWLLAFWRRCNRRDFRAALAATAALNRRTFALYDALAGAGVRFEAYQHGLLFAYRDPKALAYDHRALDLLRPFGLDPPPILGGDAAREREPALGDAIVGGFHLPDERHLRPDDLTRALAERLAADGADLRPHTPAIGFDADRSGGRVRGVRTPGGAIPAGAVLLAAGAWTPGVARLLDRRVRLPIEAGKGYGLDYAPPPRPVGAPIYLHEARVAVTPLAGLVRLAGTMEFSGLNARLVPNRIAAIARAGAAALRDWPPDPARATHWTGPRPMTPDGLPAIGLVPGWENVAVAAGHAMLGITLAPATAEAVADLLTTGDAPPTLRPFDPARFGRSRRVAGRGPGAGFRERGRVNGRPVAADDG